MFALNKTRDEVGNLDLGAISFVSVVVVTDKTGRFVEVLLGLLVGLFLLLVAGEPLCLFTRRIVGCFLFFVVLDLAGRLVVVLGVVVVVGIVVVVLVLVVVLVVVVVVRRVAVFLLPDRTVFRGFVAFFIVLGAFLFPGAHRPGYFCEHAMPLGQLLHALPTLYI